MIIFDEIEDRGCGNADLPGRSVAIASMRTTKLERFDEIRKCGKCNFENEF